MGQFKNYKSLKLAMNANFSIPTDYDLGDFRVLSGEIPKIFSNVARILNSPTSTFHHYHYSSMHMCNILPATNV